MLPMTLIQVDHKQMFLKITQNSDHKRQKLDSSYNTARILSGAYSGIKRSYGQEDRDYISVYSHGPLPPISTSSIREELKAAGIEIYILPNKPICLPHVN